MRKPVDFHVETEAELEILDSRVRYAMETATRKRFDSDISRKVTARIFGEKTWTDLVQSVSFRQSAIRTSRLVDHYINQGLPLPLKIYNLHKFVFKDDKDDLISEQITKTINTIFGPGKDLFINTRHCTDLDLLYLIYKADRFAAKKIIYSLTDIEKLNRSFSIGEMCGFCRHSLEVLGRCINRKCLRFLRPKHQEGSNSSSFGVDFVLTCSNGQSFLFDAAPFLESVIVNTNRIELMQKHITSSGQLHNSYNQVISKYYNLRKVSSVSISKPCFGHWVGRQREILVDRMSLRTPA